MTKRRSWAASIGWGFLIAVGVLVALSGTGLKFSGLGLLAWVVSALALRFSRRQLRG